MSTIIVGVIICNTQIIDFFVINDQEQGLTYFY
jgi:hypothetical protein